MKNPKKAAQKWGLRAETLCLWVLRLKGYRLLARNWRAHVGEVDLIMQKRELLVFVEVKARRQMETAAEALGPRQRERILRAALSFVAANPHLSDLGIRFDVMLVSPSRLPVHLRDAWREGWN